MNVNKRDLRVPYIYILPALLVIIFVLGIPLINLIRYSFTDVTLVGNIKKWVGLKNYRYLLTPEFFNTLSTTIIWVVFGLIGIFVVGIILSLCLNKPIPGRGIMRAIIIVPWVIPHVFAGTMWLWAFDSSSGIINSMLLKLGLISEPISFLGPNLALLSVIFVRIWKGVPFLVMNLLAGLQTIPQEVEEAAKIDGAIGMKYFLYIILPMMKPVLIMSGTILTAWSLTIFDLVYVMTRGGPLNKTRLISIDIYEKAFVNLNLGQACAIAVFTMLFILPITRFLMKKSIGSSD